MTRVLTLAGASLLVAALAAPALLPPEPSSGSHGFIVLPPNQTSFSAGAPRESFATSTAPAR